MQETVIEAIYALTPAQQGMLFHSLYEPHSGVYVVQYRCEIQGQLNVPAFERAWQRVVERHAILRTAFVWENLDRLLQVVQQQVEIRLKVQDWAGRPVDEQRQAIDAYLQADRQHGFDLAKPPLLRLSLFRLQDDAYCFLLSIHHLLVDGWSMSLVLKEVFAFYEAFQKDQELLLPRSRPYRDYINWLHKQDMVAAQAFWQRLLKGMSVPTMPPGKQVSAYEKQADAYEEVGLRLTAEATTTLNRLARRHQLTLNTLVQGAWASVLSCYSGEMDVCFGITVSGRPGELSGVESMVGLFINTLPLRVRLSPQVTVLEWLKDLQKLQAEISQYEYTPLVQIQRWSELPQGDALFESLLVFENYPVNTATGQQSLTIQNARSYEQTNYPLTFMVVPGTELLIWGTYDSQRFTKAQIYHLLEHLCTVLENMAADPEQRLVELSLLSLSEFQQVVRNETQAYYQTDQCIHQLFEAQVARTPTAIALTQGGISLSFQQLNERANQLAHFLRKQGVGPEIAVGIYTTRTPEMLIALLGVLKAGGAYVPLDPHYPAERLGFMLENAHIHILLTLQPLLAQITYKTQKIALDSDWALIAKESKDNPALIGYAQNAAYIIYTSGSTGRPKGAVITHRSCVAMLSWARELFTPAMRAGVLASTSLCFDLSVFELFLPLCWGGRVLLVENAFDLIALPDDAGVTLINTVPSALTELLKLKAVPETVKTINLAGEPLSRNLVQQVYQHTTVQQVFNLYGPTEDTTYSTFACVQPETSSEPSIGRAISNSQAYVLDGYLRPVPVGVEGQLYLGGDGLARGYLDCPDLTAASFIPDPFALQPGARLYCTGDRARLRPDGELDFLGRIDYQIKIRGFRIEIGEIENILRQHILVRDALVAVHQDENEHKRLIAYIIPEFAAVDITLDVRDFVARKLPGYMVPSAFVTLEAFPVTPNGKIDRRALPGLNAARPMSNQDSVPPSSESEERLAEIWRRLLHVEQIGIHDNFFALGGDSILSIQVVNRAKQAGLQLTPKQVFLYPTIAELAAAIGRGTLVAAEQGEITGDVPLTPIQRWFFALDPPNPHHWNQDMLLSVPPDVHIAHLEQALEYLVQHHDALRMRFVPDGSGWIQRNEPWQERSWLQHIDLRAFPAEQQAAQLEQRGGRLQKSLNITTGPLFQAAVFTLSKQERRLLLIIHHLVVDGVSWRILLEDLLLAYEQLKQGQPVMLPAKTTSYQQWARELCEYARTDTVQKEEPYWQKQTENIGNVGIALDYPDGENTVASTHTLSVALEEDVTHALLRSGTEMTALLLTTLAQTLQQWTGSSRVDVDLERHGREEFLANVDLSRTVGWFTALFPLTLDVKQAGSTDEALKEIEDQLRAVPMNGVNYGILRYLNTDQENSSRNIRGNMPISFNYMGQFDQIFEENSGWKIDAGSRGLSYDLQGKRPYVFSLNCVINDGSLHCSWTYSEELHKKSTIEYLAQSYLSLLRDFSIHGTKTQSERVSNDSTFDWNPQELGSILSELENLHD